MSRGNGGEIPAVAAIEWLARISSHDQTREALVFGDLVWCYADLATEACRVGKRLRALGVRTADLLAVVAPPSAIGVALIHGMLDEGIVMLPLNLRLTEMEQIDALRRTKARFLVVGQGVDPARAIRLADTVGCGLIEIDDETSTGAPLSLIREPRAAFSCQFDQRRRILSANQAAVVLLTSGTSGSPKAAVLGLDQLIASAEASTQLLGHASDDRWLLCMPLFHIGGLSILIRSAILGTSVILHPRFVAENVARSLEEDGITRVSFVATMLEKVIDARAGRAAPRSLSLVLLGGGPASQTLLNSAHVQGYPIAPTYGLTEAASQVATRPPFAVDADEADWASGLEPLPGVEIRVVDRDRIPVDVGHEGEIEVRGPILMAGYLHDLERANEIPVAEEGASDGRKTLGSRTKENWFATGDMGRIDTRGYLRVIDRRADLIISGGENIYPAEIESVLAGQPDIVDVGVIGVSDVQFGARPVALVVMRSGRTLEPSALEAYCRERLAGYKIPVDFVQRSALPRTASGKLIRRLLDVTSQSG